MLDKETIGDRIRRLRSARKLTQAALGEMIGKDQSSISGYEKGPEKNGYNPTEDVIERLASILGESASYLRYGGDRSSEVSIIEQDELSAAHKIDASIGDDGVDWLAMAAALDVALASGSADPSKITGSMLAVLARRFYPDYVQGNRKR